MTPFGPQPLAAPSTADERSFALLLHLAGLLSIATGIPLGGLIGVLIMWQIKGKESAFTDAHAREAMNFQISVLIYGGSLAVGGIVLAIITLGLAIPLLVLAWLGLVVLLLVGCIRGAIAANRGEGYLYPLTIRLIPPAPSTAPASDQPADGP